MPRNFVLLDCAQPDIAILVAAMIWGGASCLPRDESRWRTMPCRSFASDTRCPRVGRFWVLVLGTSGSRSVCSRRGHCAEGEADQAHREAYSGLHGRLR